MGYSRKAPHPSHGLLESYIHRSIALGAYLTMIYSVFMMSAGNFIFDVMMNNCYGFMNLFSKMLLFYFSIIKNLTNK